MSVRYLGSKTRVIDELLTHIGPHKVGSGAFVDAFCGTGAVAAAAARAGWPIRLNDNLASAVTMAHARFLSAEDVKFAQLGGYTDALEHLNALKPAKGFFWREYSPASKKHAGVARMYFTESNAKRLDAIRGEITSWRSEGRLSSMEERLLLGDLLLATNRVANIAGTYGCFLSHWSPQSQEKLALRPRVLAEHSMEINASVADVSTIQASPEDVVYFDPPYTKRQYAAYYHILETVTAGDEPTVGGVTGLRPWQTKASAFCYRNRALPALVALISKQRAKRILLSYSDEGHVPLGPLADALSKLGNLTVIPLKSIGRYRPNQVAAGVAGAVTEFLLVLERTAKHRKTIAVA